MDSDLRELTFYSGRQIISKTDKNVICVVRVIRAMKKCKIRLGAKEAQRMERP